MSENRDFSVTVIIPTLGIRKESLRRAIESVLAQKGVEAIPLVVVNGTRYDADLIASLCADEAVDLIKIETAGVSPARYAGRLRVETRYFAFLDDDDEFLPDGLAGAIDCFDQDPDLDSVVANGYGESEGKTFDWFEDFIESHSDLPLSVLTENWLTSAGGVYRTHSVPPEIFEKLPNHLEMTVLAFTICQKFKLRLIDKKLFIIHLGDTDQVSMSEAYVEAIPEVLDGLISQTDRPDIIDILRTKRSAALHLCAMDAMQKHDMRRAWKRHLQSLRFQGYKRYLWSTRHLICRMVPGGARSR